MGLDAALGKLGVKIVISSGSLMVGQVSVGRVNEALLLLLEFAKLLLLKDVRELLTDELELLLIEYIDVLVNIIVQPRMLQDILSCSSLPWHLLKHGFHQLYGILGYGVLVFNFLVELLNCV